MPAMPMDPVVHQLRCFCVAMLTISLFQVFANPWLPWQQSNPISGPQVVRLSKAPARTLEGRDVVEKNFYVGKLFIGQPQQQEFLVSFETASGQVILPTSNCDSRACSEHRRYSPYDSQTSLDVNADGHPVHFGLRLAGNHKRDALSIGFSDSELGQGRIHGTLIREEVCLGNNLNQGICTQLGVVGAHNLTDVPFRAMPVDGVVGLSLQGLSLNPLFNFFGRLVTNSLSLRPQFSLYLGPEHGELTIGGYNPSLLASSLWWTPITNPQEGYWQVSIRSISIGNTTVHSCGEGGCRGIIDSGAANLGVPSVLAQRFESTIAEHRSSGPGCSGASMIIELTDGNYLKLRAEDYLGHECSPRLNTIELPAPFNDGIILGEPFLRRYYTVFDWGSERVGFGISSAPDQGIEGLTAEIQTGWSLEEAQRLFFRAHVFTCRIAVVLLLLLMGPGLLRLSDIMVRKGFASGTLCALYCPLVPSSEAPDADECAICLGSCEEAISKGRPRWRRLCCGHKFHEECVFEWLRKSPSCPVCRNHFQHRCNQKGTQGPMDILNDASLAEGAPMGR